MIRTTMPDQNGWYWVNHYLDDENGENWQMSYLDCEGVEENEITLTTFCPEIARAAQIQKPVTVWKYHPHEQYHKWIDIGDGFDGSWSGPKVWIGPINVPGGPFGGPIVEPQYEDWRSAMANGQSIEITGTFHGGRKVVECELKVRKVST